MAQAAKDRRKMRRKYIKGYVLGATESGYTPPALPTSTPRSTTSTLPGGAVGTAGKDISSIPTNLGAPLSNLGQSIAAQPVQSNVQNALLSQQLARPQQKALNQLSKTGGLIDTSSLNQALTNQANLQFGNISDQIAQQMAFSGGLDSSARVGALAQAGAGLTTNLAAQLGQLQYGAQEAAQERRLGSLNPAIAQLGIQAGAIGQLGGLQQQGTSNAINALQGGAGLNLQGSLGRAGNQVGFLGALGGLGNTMGGLGFAHGGRAGGQDFGKFFGNLAFGEDFARRD